MAQFNSFYDILDISLLQKFCVEHGKEKLYAKGECFVREGETGRNFGFVKSGYFKYCTGRSNGEEAIGGFAFKNEALVDLSNSFMFGKPSNVTISAGCQSIVAEVTISDIKQYIYNPQIQKSGETKTKGSKSGKNPEKSQFQAVIEI